MLRPLRALTAVLILSAVGVGCADEVRTLPEHRQPKFDMQYRRGDTREGCGAASGASLLWWWHHVAGLHVLQFPSDPERNSPFDPGYAQAESELASDMRAFDTLLGWRFPGEQRAVWPDLYAPGMNAYLQRHKVPLRARALYGAGPERRQHLLERLRAQFDRGEPVVAMLFTLNVQHYGTLKGYRVDDDGEVWAILTAPVKSTNAAPLHELNLTGPWSMLAGLFWLERTP